MEKIEGYKVFKPDWTGYGDYQYEVGETFEEDITPKCCERGFHFCKELKDCFDYRIFSADCRVVKVEALGDIDQNGNQYCTNKIKIVEEIPHEKVLRLLNTGENNEGIFNTGNNNCGDYNCGNNNMGFESHEKGNLNTGNRNKGSFNVGCDNKGDSNVGCDNKGDSNVGRNNVGDRNIGCGNVGSDNVGNYNTCDGNKGSYNTGSYNTGSGNVGNDNVGCGNVGSDNIGDFNVGSDNIGDFNFTNDSIGCFNTKSGQHFCFFNKPSNWTYSKWKISRAYMILKEIKPTKWIPTRKMTEEEKKAHPEYMATGGFLKEHDKNDKERQKLWDNLNESDKKAIKDIPNFDADIFYECMDIKVN